MKFPDTYGKYGQFGGKFVPEMIMPALQELERAYIRLKNDADFRADMDFYFKEYIGRPNPLYFAQHLTKEYGGAKIYLKREDLNHTGAHKINNTVGQILIAINMKKTRIIAETGAGQHGVATATVCALFGMPCIVYMGSEDIHRQELNVFRMRLMGAEVREVKSGSKTLKDAVNEAIRDWVTNIQTTHYIFGSAVGPHPYPLIVRDFQSVIGNETKKQILEKEGKLPDAVVACVGGGSNSIGIFHTFIENAAVRLIGVEAGGEGIQTGKHAAPLSAGTLGVFHGSKSYIMQDENGQILPTHSISAGLDYPGIGPEHAWLRDTKRAEYVSVTDEEALEAFIDLSRMEGIIPALESAHALAYAKKLAPTMGKNKNMVVCLSGRGDKDAPQAAQILAGKV